MDSIVIEWCINEVIGCSEVKPIDPAIAVGCFFIPAVQLTCL